MQVTRFNECNNNRKIHKFYLQVFAIIIFPILVLLALNKTSNTELYNYHAPIYADGSGYYSYLISFFCGDEIETLPTDIDANTGNAFTINHTKKLLVTKYTAGSAVLMSPFFLMGKCVDKVFNLKQPLFSKYYTFWIILAACFYCSLALLFINQIVFATTENKGLAILLSLLLLLATNLLYYVINKPSYSHIYSFFLSASFVYLTIQLYQKFKAQTIALLFFVFGLLIICRPTNAVLILFPLFYKGNFSLKQIIVENRIALLIGMLLFLVAISPQLFYWSKISGNAFYYSYANESFSNWQHPKILHFLFSTNNGWFTYTPFMLLSLAGIWLMLKNKLYNAKTILAILIIAGYTFSSWWIPSYGCSYGMRVMIEFYPLLCIPIAYFLNYILTSKLYFKIITVSIVVICIYLNMDMIYYYDGCFYGGAWDWQAYLKLLEN